MEQSKESLASFNRGLLKPAILQILRAQGFYSCRPSVLETLTEVAADYLFRLSHIAKDNAERNNAFDSRLTVHDARIALEETGALNPNQEFIKEVWAGQEDLSGLDSFVRWVQGGKNAKINRVASAFEQSGDLPVLDEERAQKVERDWLSEVRKKHSKNDQDSKYADTVLGKGIDHGEVMVEGGDVSSLQEWAAIMRERAQQLAESDHDSRPPSSGLSSLDDGDVEMMDL